MKVFDVFKRIYQLTNSKYIAIKLIEFHCGGSKESILANFNNELQYDEDIIFNDALSYLNGTPLEYITNKSEFFNREFFVDERVLIPRFETEILVNKCIKLIIDKDIKRVFEIGFGSGIISITLFLEAQKYGKTLEIICSDISKGAFEVATKNARNLDAKIEFKHCAYLDKIDGDCELLVSNPPYIQNGFKLDKNVLKEPKEALFGGDIGDEILKNIILISKNRTQFLACEIGYNQKKSLELFLRENQFLPVFYKDLAGFDRGFLACNEQL